MQTRAPSRPDRLFEYFVLVGAGSYPAQADDCIDVGLQPLRPVIEARLPREDYSQGESLPDLLPLFCFPHGIPLRVCDVRPSKPPPPILHMFVLTASDGAQLYGAAAVFEDIVPARLLDKALSAAHAEPITEGHVAVWARALCVLSRWPFISVLGDVARLLAGARYMKHSVPMERVLCNLLCDVPLPPPGVVAVAFELIGTRFSIACPPPNRLPLADVAFGEVLQRLGTAVVDVFLCCLLECKLLFVARTSSSLMQCQEALRALLFPFEWQHVYIPLLPPALSAVLDAPVPFMVGIVGSGGVAGTAANPDVVIIDVDSGAVALPSDVNLPRLPERAHHKLLRVVSKQVALARSKSGADHVDVKALREGFLRFMVSVMLNYRHYIVVPRSTRAPSMQPATFDTNAWIVSHDETTRPFIRQLASTQAFQVFMDNRLVPSADKTGAFARAFFEESIIAKINRSRLKLAKLPTPFLDDTSLLHNSVFHAPAPSRIDLSQDEYLFSELPNFRESLLLPLHPPTSLQSRAASLLDALSRLTTAFRTQRKEDRLRENKLAEHTAEFVAYEKRQTDEIAQRRAEHQKTLKAARLARAATTLIAHYRRYGCTPASCSVLTWIRHCAQRRFLRYKHAVALFQQRFRYRRMRRAALLLQCRQRYRRLRRKFHAAVLSIQRTRRAVLTRRAFLRMRKMATVLQSAARRFIAIRYFAELVANAFINLRDEVAVLWQASRTLFSDRAAFYLAHTDPSLHSLVAYRREYVRLQALTSSELKTMRKTQRTERRAMEAAMKQGLSESEVADLFVRWNVPLKARYRKRKLLKVVFVTPARLDEAVRFVVTIGRLMPASHQWMVVSSAHPSV